MVMNTDKIIFRMDYPEFSPNYYGHFPSNIHLQFIPVQFAEKKIATSGRLKSKKNEMPHG